MRALESQNRTAESGVSMMLQRALQAHAHKLFHFPASNQCLSYAEVDALSQRVAGELRRRGVERGSLVGLLFATGPGFIAAFIGVLRLGAVAVPLPHPGTSRAFANYVARLTSILKSADARTIITGDEFAAALGGQKENLPAEVQCLTFDELCDSANGHPSDFDEAPPRADEPALVQYTSGSTSVPKGVRLTQGNLAAGIEAIILGIQLTSADVNGQWLPLHHDMGLIGMLAGIAAGTDHYLWPPIAFIRRPGRWLQAFAEKGATIYAGPSFSYAAMLRRLDTKALDGLELSAWRVAFNGAEVIDPDVLQRFIARFSSHGLRAETLFPVYGLAEATLATTFPKLGEAPRILWVNRDGLTGEGKACLVAAGSPGARGLVCVGEAVSGHEVRVVNPRRLPCAAGQVGEIEFRGPAAMSAYHGRTPEQSGVSAEGWVRTGDLGFLWDGGLYVSGRLKELIIVRGEQFYPTDVEQLVQDLDCVYHGHVVAFAESEYDAERIVVVSELTPGFAPSLAKDTIRERIMDGLGLTAVQVVTVPARTILRTTSGKFQRLRMRKLWREGALATLPAEPLKETHSVRDNPQP